MQTLKWWIIFAGYALCWLVGTAWWYILHPFRMVQIEVGSMADWGVKNMKRMVAYLPVLALAIALPVCACAAGNETRYYGPKGDYVGRSSVNNANPSQRSIYSNKGEYLGRAMTKPDGSVKYYDPHGNFQGSSLPSKRPYQKK